MKNSLYLMILILIASCSQDKKTAEKSSEKKFEMYELSEMSMVMEQMYVENQRLKDKIIAGEAIGEYSDFFDKIETSKTTEPGQFDDFFKEHAVLFLNTQKAIYAESNQANQKATFNTMVDACIKCHEVKCQGPIDRIEKLYID
jgi:cytochrome c553